MVKKRLVFCSLAALSLFMVPLKGYAVDAPVTLRSVQNDLRDLRGMLRKEQFRLPPAQTLAAADVDQLLNDLDHSLKEVGQLVARGDLETLPKAMVVTYAITVQGIDKMRQQLQNANPVEQALMTGELGFEVQTTESMIDLQMNGMSLADVDAIQNFVNDMAVARLREIDALDIKGISKGALADLDRAGLNMASLNSALNAPELNRGNIADIVRNDISGIANVSQNVNNIKAVAALDNAQTMQNMSNVSQSMNDVSRSMESVVKDLGNVAKSLDSDMKSLGSSLKSLSGSIQEAAKSLESAGAEQGFSIGGFSVKNGRVSRRSNRR